MKTHNAIMLSLALLIGGAVMCVPATVTMAADVATPTKEPVTDSWLTSKAKIALFADGRVKGRQINVETKNGVVMLRGKVDNDEAKSAAEETAKGIDGVKSFGDDPEIMAAVLSEANKLGLGSTAHLSQDHVVRMNARHVEGHDSAAQSKIDIKTNAGVVSLTGEVPDLTTSAKASWTAWKVSGVKSVKNDLTVMNKK